MNTVAGRLRAAAHVPAAIAAAAVLIGAALTAAPLAADAADLNAVNRAASAANAASGVAASVGAGTAVPPLGIGAVLQTLAGLAIVITLVFGCAWLARRLGLQPSARGQLVRTVGGVSLGGKERVAVVEIGDTWLVLGAAPGNVRLLHTMPAQSAQATPDSSGGSGPPGANEAALSGTFGSRFRAALSGEAKKRFSRTSGGGK